MRVVIVEDQVLLRAGLERLFADGGHEVVAAHGWFAARPSGTEDVYKIYAESFLGADHLRRIQQEARQIVTDLLTTAKASGSKSSAR